jgi:leucyl-tRNA---protein transferase
MEIIFSEFQNLYTTYTFAYAVYCRKESQAELPEIFAKGFLPYTGIYTLSDDYFYLARSVRVNLSQFADTSENRRLDRKLSSHNVRVTRYRKEDFPFQDRRFRDFCLNYAKERFKGGVMDEERLSYLFARNMFTHIFVFQREADPEPLGYVFSVMQGDMLHYWYSFYDVRMREEYSFGKWMMWRMIRWAKENGLRHIYLGTAYKRAALYKVRDHKGIEYFDGAGWRPDPEQLARLCTMDEEPIMRDRDLFKLVHQKLDAGSMVRVQDQETILPISTNSQNSFSFNGPIALVHPSNSHVSQIDTRPSIRLSTSEESEAILSPFKADY